MFFIKFHKNFYRDAILWWLKPKNFKLLKVYHIMNKYALLCYVSRDTSAIIGSDDVKFIDKLIALWSLNRQAKIFLGIKTFSRYFFWEEPSKYYIVEFTAVSVSLLLSWSRRYLTKWNSNFKKGDTKGNTNFSCF